jgi:multicomponent Na+:H+ antiporter subunit D
MHGMLQIIPPRILPPLPVVLPLTVAGLLLVFAHVLPKRAPDVIAIVTALLCGLFCLAMIGPAGSGPLVYWFGNWVPHDGLVIGIGFAVGPIDAAMGVLIALLFAASLLFAWGFFDEIHAHFQILMLLFLAAMIGFCLTHDLFNMFVWFEVLSVAGFALTGYRLEASALEGALNFTVTNSLGSFAMLGGIGLIYAKAGALDFAALARGVGDAGVDPVIAGAFCMIATAMLIKGAMAPFHFWLSDAHTVAPSPVSVIFSGAMVSIGIFGLTKLTWAVFAGNADVLTAMRHLALGMGIASALVGGFMCLSQRHLKRLLAFSTISHVGIMLAGAALLSPAGAAGMLLYLGGHGLTKGALFMVAGILLAMRGGIDEIGLRGLGRGIMPAGVAMAIGGLILAGAPIGLMDRGAELIDDAGGAFVTAALLLGGALTGGAVLRAAGRIFLGLGEVPGEESRAPSESEQEAANRPLWLMMIPCALLLVLALVPSGAKELVAHALPRFMFPDGPSILGTGHAPPAPIALPAHASHPWLPWVSTLLAIAIAAFDLFRRHLPRVVVRGSGMLTTPIFSALDWVHSGLIGDYVAWIAVGLACFAAAFAFA